MFLVVNTLRHVMMRCDVKPLVPQIRKTLQKTLVNADGFKGGKIVQDHEKLHCYGVSSFQSRRTWLPGMYI